MMPLFSSLLHFATLTQLPSYRSTVPKARNPLVVVPETDLCTCHIYVLFPPIENMQFYFARQLQRYKSNFLFGLKQCQCNKLKPFTQHFAM